MFLFKSADLLFQAIDPLGVDFLGDSALGWHRLGKSSLDALGILPLAFPFGRCPVDHRGEQNLKGLSIHLHRKFCDCRRFLK